MRSSCTALYTLVVSVAFLAQTTKSTSCEDTSELFQATAHLHEDPTQPDVLQMVYKPLDKMREMLRKAQDTFNQEVKEVAREAVKQELEKMPIPGVSEPQIAASQEAAVPEQAAANASFAPTEAVPTKIEWTTFYVRMPSGRQLPSTTKDSSQHLQAFMKGFCNKMHISCTTTKFLFKGQELKPLGTAGDFGLQSGDVIDVSGPEIEMIERNAVADSKKAAERREKRAQEEEEAAKEKAAAEHQQQLAEIKRKERVAGAKRQVELKRQDRVTLSFVREVNGQPSDEALEIAVKHDNWLQGTMELVCKRLGLDVKTTKFFRSEPRGLISPHDSIKTLGLQEMEQILVRAQHK